MSYTGVLFVNEKKTLDKHPDYRGQMEVDGRKFWIASWVRATGKGQVQSLNIEEFTEEDYRKSADIAVKKAEEAALLAQQEAARQTQGVQSRWGAPQTTAPSPASTATVQQPAPINQLHVQQVQQNAPVAPPVYSEPPADYDDDIPF